MAFDLDPSYKQVPERIADFKAKHPEGSLQPADPTQPYQIATVGGREFIVYTAAAYRAPDDPRPGIGIAWEPFPGKSPYTRDSEMMNAETSAWGRAIVAALASESKSVASAEEVRNRQADSAPRTRTRPPAANPDTGEITTTRRPPPSNGAPTCGVCNAPIGTEAARKVAGRFVHLYCSPAPESTAPPAGADQGEHDSLPGAGGTSSARPQSVGVGGGVAANPPAAPPLPSDGPSQKQLGMIGALLTKLGVSDDDRHRYVSDLLDLPLRVPSLKSLSKKQASQLIDLLMAEEASSVPS